MADGRFLVCTSEIGIAACPLRHISCGPSLALPLAVSIPPLRQTRRSARICGRHGFGSFPSSMNRQERKQEHGSLGRSKIPKFHQPAVAAIHPGFFKLYRI
jgi:hypothetical protein